MCITLQTSLFHGIWYQCAKRCRRVLEHANEEQGHADQIAQRIVQLGG